MSDERQFSADYYLSFPHLRLTNKKFIVLENSSLYLVKIRGEHSQVIFIEQISDILKMEVAMVRSRYGSYLYAYFLPREGKKKVYFVSPLKGFYKDEDWQRIVEFFRETGFKPHLFPDREKASKETRPINMDEKVWFSPNDRIFQLYEDPVFFDELSMIKIGFWPIFLSILGFSCILPAIIFAIIAIEQTWIAVLILFSISMLFLLFGLPQWILHKRRRKEFAQKYNIEYYFK